MEACVRTVAGSRHLTHHPAVSMALGQAAGGRGAQGWDGSIDCGMRVAPCGRARAGASQGREARVALCSTDAVVAVARPRGCGRAGRRGGMDVSQMAFRLRVDKFRRAFERFHVQVPCCMVGQCPSCPNLCRTTQEKSLERDSDSTVSGWLLLTATIAAVLATRVGAVGRDHGRGL
eukprot:3871680-Prymnesium_polylepis.1